MTKRKFSMPGLASMTKLEMAKQLQSIWVLCNEQRVPKKNMGTKMNLYGRVYQGLVLGKCTTPFRFRKHHN